MPALRHEFDGFLSDRPIDANVGIIRCTAHPEPMLPIDQRTSILVHDSVDQPDFRPRRQSNRWPGK